jgi:hypothetical protein
LHEAKAPLKKQAKEAIYDKIPQEVGCRCYGPGWVVCFRSRKLLSSIRILENPMYFVGLLIFAISVFLAPGVAVAQTQPGSAGGTIGKHEKSISGDEEQPKAKSRSSHARLRPASHVTHPDRGPAAAPRASSNCRLFQQAQHWIEICD